MLQRIKFKFRPRFIRILFCLLRSRRSRQITTVFSQWLQARDILMGGNVMAPLSKGVCRNRYSLLKATCTSAQHVTCISARNAMTSTSTVMIWLS